MSNSATPSPCYGAQGDTTDTGAPGARRHTSAAPAYVAMTRGRDPTPSTSSPRTSTTPGSSGSTAFSRDRADLGPTHAADAAARAGAGYTTPRPLTEVSADLWQAWDLQADAEDALRQLRPALDRALAAEPRVTADRAAEQAAWARSEQARAQLDTARTQLAATQQAIDHTAEQVADQLRHAWDAQRPDAQRDARRITAGTGHLGRGRAEIAAATHRLETWAAHWQPVVGDLHQHRAGLVGFAAAHPGNDTINQRLRDYARTRRSTARPERSAPTEAVTAAEQHSRTASEEWGDLNRHGARHAVPTIASPPPKRSEGARPRARERTPTPAGRTALAALRAGAGRPQPTQPRTLARNTTRGLAA